MCIIISVNENQMSICVSPCQNIFAKISHSDWNSNKFHLNFDDKPYDLYWIINLCWVPKL